MWRKFERMPSGPTAIAFTALLIALSGTAVALPGKNKVDSGDIKNGQVKSADIGKGQVKSSDLANNAVTGGKVNDGTLTGADINESALGKVPSAASADTAGSANTANSAANASALGGLGAGSYERVGRFENGVGTDTSTTKELLLSWPELGFELYTDGDADSNNQLRFKNTRTGDPANVFNACFFQGTSETCNAPGFESEITFAAPDARFLVFNQADKTFSEQVQCNFLLAVNNVICSGTRSKPGSIPVAPSRARAPKGSGPGVRVTRQP